MKWAFRVERPPPIWARGRQSRKLIRRTRRAKVGLGELYQVRTVLLVSGKAAYSGSGAEKTLASLASEFEVVRFCDFTANPTTQEVGEAIRLVPGSVRGNTF